MSAPRTDPLPPGIRLPVRWKAVEGRGIRPSSFFDSAMIVEAKVKMNESNRRVIQFLEKEIKTYLALARYLSKEGLLKERVRVGRKEMLMTPAFYKERMKEAKNLVSQLRK